MEKTKEISKQDYMRRFWQAKYAIKNCGVYKIMPLLIKENLISKDPRNEHYLQGRIKNDLFLLALEDLAEILKNE